MHSQKELLHHLGATIAHNTKQTKTQRCNSKSRFKSTQLKYLFLVSIQTPYCHNFMNCHSSITIIHTSNTTSINHSLQFQNKSVPSATTDSILSRKTSSMSTSRTLVHFTHISDLPHESYSITQYNSTTQHSSSLANHQTLSASTITVTTSTTNQHQSCNFISILVPILAHLQLFQQHHQKLTQPETLPFRFIPPPSSHESNHASSICQLLPNSLKYSVSIKYHQLHIFLHSLKKP